MSECVSHMSECVSHMSECVSHMSECVSHMSECVSHMSESCHMPGACDTKLCAASKIFGPGFFFITFISDRPLEMRVEMFPDSVRPHVCWRNCWFCQVCPHKCRTNAVSATNLKSLSRT